MRIDWIYNICNTPMFQRVSTLGFKDYIHLFMGIYWNFDENVIGLNWLVLRFCGNLIALNGHVMGFLRNVLRFHGKILWG